MLVVLLALGASAQTATRPDETPAPPAPPVGVTEEGRAAHFTPWATALASGNRDAAAAVLTAIIDDPMRSELHGEAWAHLGEIFESTGLEYAAIGAYGRGISLDAKHSGSVVGKGLALVDKLAEPGLLAEALGKNVGVPVDASLKNQLALVASSYHLDDRSYGPALGILMMADSAGADFEDVELMRGIVLSNQNRHGEALAPLITAQAMGVQKGRDARWNNVAVISIARAYYSSGNYGQAITWYAKVERSSDWWLDAQFERGWAHFRGNDMNGSLAMLFNHDSAFFTDFFTPEADLLRAYTLFMMCKFPDASKEMDAFLAKYQPMQATLASISMNPEAAFEDVRAYRAGKPTQLPEYLLRPYRYEKRFDDAFASVARADEELPKVSSLSGRAGAMATELIQTQRDARIQAEGARVLARTSAARGDLDAMLEGIEITRLDLLNLEAQMYERAAATGVLDYGDRIGRLRELKKAKRGFRVWPWQGEAWADELGWYVFSSRPDCPDTMSAGEKKE